MGRKDLADQAGPLDERDPVSIKIVLVAHLVHFADIADAVYVKMVQWEPSSVILLDDGKGRAVHRLCDPHSAGKALGKYRLSHAQIAV